MRIYSIKRFLGLLALYAVLFVGIFVLQFKTESVVNRSYGEKKDLKVSLAHTQGSGDEMKLKNQFQINYKGIMLLGNDASPVQVFNTANASVVHSLTLSSFNEEPDGVTLTFNDGSLIRFHTADQLIISAEPSAENDCLTLEYKISSDHKMEDFTSMRILFDHGNEFFALTAPALDKTRITLTTGNNTATFASYDPEKTFEFAAVAGIAQSNTVFSANIKQFRDSVVTRFVQASTSLASDPLTEQEVTAYVAEMAVRKTFTEGLNAVPDSFKNGNRRTYLSAPYFGHLADMDRTLVMKNEQLASMVNTAIASRNLDIFTIDGVADFILREKKKPIITTLLSMPTASDTPVPTVLQAAGILSTYTKLRASDKDLSANLEGAVQGCISVIGENCRIENGGVYVSQNGTELKPGQTVLVGLALLSYGSLSQNSDYVETGKLLISRPIETNSLSFQECAELYPLLVPENKFYPHAEILGYYDSESVWAWTCASQLSYQIGDGGVVSISMKFPVDESHFAIFKGIPNFTRIEIYKQRYRSAKDFEDYNVSGYVYDELTKNLYIKSKHKSESELVRLWCRPATNFSEK
ncbi:MAG: hypothetical protein VZR56_02505 [Treponema sp.]|nr:hypothetical protein [Treponema sp.]